MEKQPSRPPSDPAISSSSHSEEWRPVAGYEGRYDVSDQGRVRVIWFTAWTGERFNYKPAKVLKATRHRTGYEAISLVRDGNKKLAMVHRLVAGAFIPARPGADQVAHLDGNASNNRAENLVWATAQENTLHKFEHGTVLQGSRNPGSKLRDDDVLTIRRTYRRGVEGVDAGALAERFGVSPNTIDHIAKGRTWRSLAAAPTPPGEE